MTYDFAIEALYNEARRYCIVRIDQLLDVQQQSGARVADQQALLAGVRLLHAILMDIERTLPEEFAEEREVRDYLLSCDKNARVLNWHTQRRLADEHADEHIVYQEPSWTEAELAGLESARAEYTLYVSELTAQEAALVEKVPYRHVLSDTKRRHVLESLAENWSVDPLRYWHPLRGEELPPNVAAFQEQWFQKEVGVERLQSILLSRGITRVWEINEFGLEPEYELDPRLCDFSYSPEKYWSSLELDWLVYVSHESSITFAGDWLISEIKKAWPNWEQRIYIDWQYEQPPHN